MNTPSQGQRVEENEREQGTMGPTYMRGGRRKGTGFQEWGLVPSVRTFLGQSAGGNAPGAAPDLSIAFQDPHNSGTLSATHPQYAISCPNLAAASKIPSAQHFRRRGLFDLCATFHKGGHSTRPPLPGSSQQLSLPARGLPGSRHLKKLYSEFPF